MSYGKFRNFLILLPEAKLREADPSIAWFEAATMVPFGMPSTKPCTALSSGSVTDRVLYYCNELHLKSSPPA